jgi:hypothetical protein
LKWKFWSEGTALHEIGKRWLDHENIRFFAHDQDMSSRKNIAKKLHSYLTQRLDPNHLLKSWEGKFANPHLFLSRGQTASNSTWKQLVAGKWDIPQNMTLGIFESCLHKSKAKWIYTLSNIFTRNNYIRISLFRYSQMIEIRVIANFSVFIMQS